MTARAGEILAFQIRQQWRITRAEFAQWLHAQPGGSESRGGNDDGR